jgi:isochorismate hydrolase
MMKVSATASSPSLAIGLIAHTCVEATVRYGAELGYEVTMVKDATASYSDEEMHAALDINIPNYASAIVTTAGGPAYSIRNRQQQVSLDQPRASAKDEFFGIRPSTFQCPMLRRVP